MKQYKVIFSEESIKDLEEIEEYIIFKLKSLDAAINTVNGIIDTAEKLNLLPKHEMFQSHYRQSLN